VIRLEVIPLLEQKKAVFKRWSTMTLSVCAVCLGLLLCVPLFVYWPEPYRPSQPPAAIEAVAPTSQTSPGDGGWVDATRPTRALVEYALDQGLGWLERSLAATQAPPPPKPADIPPAAPLSKEPAAPRPDSPSLVVVNPDPRKRTKRTRRAPKQYLRSSDGMTMDVVPGPSGPLTFSCGAPTLDGTPCRRLVLGGGRCWQHRGY
jgi:hypothetical protein